jgi:hypothetical protein
LKIVIDRRQPPCGWQRGTLQSRRDQEHHRQDPRPDAEQRCDESQPGQHTDGHDGGVVDGHAEHHLMSGVCRVHRRATGLASALPDVLSALPDVLTALRGVLRTWRA